MIQRSARVILLLSIDGGLQSFRFIRENLAAFHILLIKFLYPAILSSESLMSLPWIANTARVNLKASVPNLSNTSSGSIMFPLLLLIFWPCSSLTRAWI
jgi:hypothetical protein